MRTYLCATYLSYRMQWIVVKPIKEARYFNCGLPRFALLWWWWYQNCGLTSLPSHGLSRYASILDSGCLLDLFLNWFPTIWNGLKNSNLHQFFLAFRGIGVSDNRSEDTPTARHAPTVTGGHALPHTPPSFCSGGPSA